MGAHSTALAGRVGQLLAQTADYRSTHQLRMDQLTDRLMIPTLGAAALTLLIGLSRVWLGVHYPSDVVAGWLGGAGWSFLASAVLYRPAAEVAEAGA